MRARLLTAGGMHEGWEAGNPHTALRRRHQTALSAAATTAVHYHLASSPLPRFGGRVEVRFGPASDATLGWPRVARRVARHYGLWRLVPQPRPLAVRAHVVTLPAHRGTCLFPRADVLRFKKKKIRTSILKKKNFF